MFAGLCRWLRWRVPRRCRYCQARGECHVDDVGFVCAHHVGRGLAAREWDRMLREATR